LDLSSLLCAGHTWAHGAHEGLNTNWKRGIFSDQNGDKRMGSYPLVCVPEKDGEFGEFLPAHRARE